MSLSRLEAKEDADTANATLNSPRNAHTGTLFCKCNLCMRSGKLSPDEQKENSSDLAATMVDRKDPDAGPDSPSLMRSIEAHSIVQTDTQINLLAMTGISSEAFPSKDRLPPVYAKEGRELTLRAKWLSKSQEEVISAQNASGFGTGVLLVSPDEAEVNIPKVNPLRVSQEFLESFGVELIPLEKPVDIEPAEHALSKNLYLVQYDFEPDFFEKYVMKMRGGGGVFVETHSFPHTFTPMSKDCSGALLVGRECVDGSFSFTSIGLPFGYTLKTKPYAIHGDWFFVGSFAITLNGTEPTDTVLIRQDSPTRDIQRVTITEAAPAGLEELQNRRLVPDMDTNEMDIKALCEIRSRWLAEIWKTRHRHDDNVEAELTKPKGLSAG